MAINVLSLEKTSTPFKGFETGAYTLYIGPDHKKLTVPGYVLTRIPPINKLIIDKNLVENEPVSLEAYDPQAFATVLALVRDGYDGFKILQTSHQLVKAYVVAYDLNLEDIQNFLINQIRIFHWTHPVQPQDFELLYAAQLTSDCKIHAFLLHKIAHDFHMGLYRNDGSRGGRNLDPEHIKKLTCLSKVDLIQMSYQITLLSTKWQCAPCQEACFFHDHVLTPKCTTVKNDEHGSPKNPAVAAAQLEANAKDHIFRFTIKKPIPTTETKIAQSLHATCVTEDPNTVTSDLLNPHEDYAGTPSYTKVAQWLDATAGSKKDQPRSPILVAGKSLPAKIMSSGEESRDQSDRTSKFTERSLLNLPTPSMSLRTEEESKLQEKVVSALPKPSTHQKILAGRVASTEEPSKTSKAVALKSTTDVATEEKVCGSDILEKFTRSSSKSLTTPAKSRSPCLSTHASGPRLSSEVVQSITQYSRNENGTCGRDVLDGQKCSSKASTQEDALDKSAVCNEDRSSSEEDDQESESDGVPKNIEQLERQERLRNTGALGANYYHTRSLGETLKEVKTLRIAAEDLQKHFEREGHKSRYNTTFKPYPGAGISSEQRMDKTMSRFRQTGNIKSQRDANSLGSPPSQPSDFSPCGASSDSELREESNKGNSQTIKKAGNPESQGCMELDDDKNVLREVEEEIEGFKKDLGI